MKETHVSDLDRLLTRVADLTTSNGNTVARFGAQLLIQYQFIDAGLPQLSVAQRRKAILLFRQGVENVMSETDDIAMPASYYAALLEETVCGSHTAKSI